MPGSVLRAVGEIILFLRTWNLVEKKVMYTRNYSTRQREICAKIGVQPWYTAKAKEWGLHSHWEKLRIERLSGSSSYIEYKLPFHNSPRVYSWAGVKSSLFHVRVTDVKGTSFLQKSEEIFQTAHAALLVTNLHLSWEII